MRPNIFCRYVATMVLMFLLGAKVYGATSAEYAAAGLQLYNQKNYSQAIQYYSAAISLDPNNTAALQGRANCYYSLGQNQEALNDYQKVQAIAPNPQLAQFIQALQAKVGTAPPAVGAVVGGSYDQGVGLYQQKQYAAAVPYLQKATQENPNDSKAYYYLGATYMMMGDNKNAAVNLAISNQKQPNPSVEAYVTQLKARLSPEDQQWVDGQVTASATAGSASVAAPASNKKMGIRFQPAISLLDLKDFTTSAQTYQNAGTTLRLADPNVSYTGHVPTGCINFSIEGVYKLTPNLELGIPIGFMPVGTADDNFIIPSSGPLTFVDSFDISAFTVGANVRYLIGTGDFQPFVGAGLLIAPISINFSSTASNPVTALPSSGPFSSLGVGGQVQLGLDWHLGDTFVISPFVGYQFLSATNFSATVASTNGSAVPAGQTAVLSLVPDAYGNGTGAVIFPVAGGKVVPWGYTAPTGTTPISVDLGGIKAGIQLSAFF